MLLLVFLLVGCPSQKTNPAPAPVDPVDPNPKPPVVEAKLAVERIVYSLWNYDATFDSTASARVRFFIDFKNPEVKAEDIMSMKIVSEHGAGRSWSDDNAESIKESMGTTTDGVVYYDTERLFSNFYSKNGSVIPLGNYEFSITPTEGDVVTYTQTVAATGSTGTKNKKFTFTEDYVNAANPLVDYDPLLKRANISAAFLDASQTRLTVKFKVNDVRVYGGVLWLYDKDDRSIGVSKTGFRDFESGEVSTIINGGTVIKTGGAENNVIVEAPQLDLNDGKSISDIKFVRVLLGDGRQHQGKINLSGVASVSAVKPVDAGASQ